MSSMASLPLLRASSVHGLASAAAPQRAASSEQLLSPDADVATAVRLASAALGRPPSSAEDAIVQRLQDEWYTRAADVAALSDEQARSLGVPLRLRAEVGQLLARQRDSGSTSSSGSAPQQQQPRAAAASKLGATPLPPRAASMVGSFVSFLTGGRGDAVPGAEEARSEAPDRPGPAVPAEPLAAVPRAAEAASATALPAAALDSELVGAAAAAAPSSSDGGELDAVPEAAPSAAAAGGGAPTSDEGDSEQAAWVPIEERRCPAMKRFGHSFSDVPRVTRRGRPERYALQASEMPPALAQEFEAFARFSTSRFYGQQAEPVAAVTAAKYADHVRSFLGYIHRQRGVPLGELSFATALPSANRDGVRVLFEYLIWLQQERGIGVRTELLVIRSAMQAAKFLYHEQSKVNTASGDKPYSDLGIIQELRKMQNDAKKASKVAARTADETAKWLDWPEYLQVVQELKKECAGRDSNGRLRAPSAVAWSLQRYLIFAILACVPDRQRTLRELRVGSTLVQDAAGRWVIRHGPGDYKTGRAYGERPPLVVAPRLYPELEAFVSRWRAELRPSHDFLFSQANGEPLSDKSLYKLFWTTAYRLTGKKVNPHLIRDSIVTYLRGGGASERELEALAIYMGHSVQMQRSTYDRRTKQQKVEPAVELLESLNQRAMTQGGGYD